MTLAYRRVLLKLSGEALTGDADFGISPEVIQRLANEIKELIELGVQPALVVGGGNIFRGAALSAAGMDKVTSDQIGMLATAMNGLAMQDALQQCGLEVRLMSAIHIAGVCDDFVRWRAVQHLDKGRVVIFVAGTGNPFFTTDSAASLRAIEIGADLMIKATKVDGVYDKDPVKYPDAQRYTELTYAEVIDRRLGVMDTTAVVLCQENNLPMKVLDMGKRDALRRAVTGEPEGTLIC
ncbi:MAG: UMP kinase [Pseudomonadota bacterium]